MIVVVFTKQLFDAGAARVWHGGHNDLAAGKRAASTVVVVTGTGRRYGREFGHHGFAQERSILVTAMSSKHQIKNRPLIHSRFKFLMNIRIDIGYRRNINAMYRAVRSVVR